MRDDKFELITGVGKDMSAYEAYVTIYAPIVGFKSVLMGKDPNFGGRHAPYCTGPMPYWDRKQAIMDGFAWAVAGDIPFYLKDPTEEESLLLERLEQGRLLAIEQQYPDHKKAT